MKNLGTALRRSAILWPVLFLGVFTSCGRFQGIVSDVKVRSYDQNQDIYVSMDAQLNLGGVMLDDIKMPIKHPRTGVKVGQVIIGATSLSVALNVSTVVQWQVETATLPNGKPLPLIGENKVVVLPVGKSGVEVYVTFVNGAYALGVTLPLKFLDQLGAKIGNKVFFLPFNVDKIQLSTGTYMSPVAGENGIGVFLDLGTVLNPIQVYQLAGLTYGFYSGNGETFSLQYDGQDDFSRRDEKRYYQYIQRYRGKRVSVD